MFWSGNCGNRGNRANKALKLQQSLVPTFGVFGSHSSHFPFCIGKLPTLFFKDFFKKPKYYHNAYFLCIFTLISTIINELRQYHYYALLNCISQVVLKPPNVVTYFSKILLFFVCRRKFL